MNPILIKKQLNPTLVALWGVSKHGKVDRNFATQLREEVQAAKVRWRQDHDPLADKLRRFPGTGSWANQKMQELARVVYNNKAPDNVNLGDWVSVEIECLFRDEARETAFVSFVRKKGYSKYVTVKTDGSIHPEEIECDCPTEDDDGERLDCVCEAAKKRGYGKEIVITFQYGNWDFVQDICHKLNELKCFVNKTCGLHVHFDCRHLETRRQVSTLGIRVARTIPVLKQLLPPSRRDNRFCERDINRHVNPRRRVGNSKSRYSFVNLEAFDRHKTIEIRGHSGTTDANKIVFWIKMLRTIMTKRNTKTIQTVSELINVFKFDSETAEYIISRYGKFNGKIVDGRVDDIAADNEGLVSFWSSDHG